MILVDANILIYAHVSSFAQHSVARDWLDQQLNGSGPVGLPWASVLAFLRLVTNRLDLPAEVVALAYRFRWQIELFFRWFKCVLGCRHLVSTSANGVRLQVYVALIVSLLISLWTGHKPTKRTLEMIQHYINGKLYLILFDAARSHYYNALLPDYEAIVASAQRRG